MSQGDTHFFANRSTRFFLHMKEQLKYYLLSWYLGDSGRKKKFTVPREVLPFVANISNRSPASETCHLRVLLTNIGVTGRITNKAEVCRNFDLSGLVALSNCLKLSMVLTLFNRVIDRRTQSLQFHPLLNTIQFSILFVRPISFVLQTY